MSHYQARRSPRTINEAAVRQYLHGSVDSLVRYELLLLLQYIHDPNPAVLVNVVYGNYRGGLQLREPQKAREKQWRSCQELVTLLPEISHPSDALCRYQQSFGQRHHERPNPGLRPLFLCMESRGMKMIGTADAYSSQNLPRTNAT